VNAECSSQDLASCPVESLDNQEQEQQPRPKVIRYPHTPEQAAFWERYEGDYSPEAMEAYWKAYPYG